MRSDRKIGLYLPASYGSRPIAVLDPASSLSALHIAASFFPSQRYCFMEGILPWMKAWSCAVAAFSAQPLPNQVCFAALRALILLTVSVEAFVEASAEVKIATLLES